MAFFQASVKQELLDSVNSVFADNANNEITAQRVRNFLADLIEKIDTGQDITVLPGSITVVGSGSFSLPADSLLHSLVVIATADSSFRVGTTVGGAELYDQNIVDGNKYFVDLGHYADTATTIHITGDCIIKPKIFVYA